MDILIADEKVFLLVEQFDMAQAKERAWDKKTTVFGAGLTSLLNRPRPEDVQLTKSQKRYEPFWHARCHSTQRYDRSAKFEVAVGGSAVKQVTLLGQDLAPANGKLTLTGVEHCVDEQSRDRVYDGMSSTVKEWQGYLKYPASEVPDPAQFSPTDALVLMPQLKASFVVRQLLGEMLKPVQADVILEETLVIDAINLYYRPVYAFEFEWKAKERTAVAELDGLTGELKMGGQMSDARGAKSVITRDALFDIGADAAGLILPGANIAIKLVKAGIDYRQRGGPPPPAP